MLKLIREKGYYCVVTGRIKDEYTEDGKRTRLLCPGGV